VLVVNPDTVIDCPPPVVREFAAVNVRTFDVIDHAVMAIGVAEDVLIAQVP
jgi:hypothetical protein